MRSPATFCDVTLWHVDLTTAAAIDASILSPREQDCAAAIMSPTARSLYILAHVRLREVLGNWMNIAPARVAFDTGWNGKPCLKGGARPQFSLSHSGQRAVIATCRTASIGVDIETIRQRKLDSQTARRFFSEDDNAQLQGLSETDHRTAFTRLWTFKEAFIKATGAGLARRLDSFGIDIATECLIHGEDPADWQLSGVTMPTQYAGALAVQTKLPLRITVADAEVASKRDIRDQAVFKRVFPEGFDDELGRPS